MHVKGDVNLVYHRYSGVEECESKIKSTKINKKGCKELREEFWYSSISEDVASLVPLLASFKSLHFVDATDFAVRVLRSRFARSQRVESKSRV